MENDYRKRQIIDEAFKFLHFWLEKEDLDFNEAFTLWCKKKQDEKESKS